MMPKIKGKDVQFFVVQPVYKSKVVKKKNEFGLLTNQEVNTFVKEVYAKVWMERGAIGPYGEYVGSKGELLINRTLIFNRSTDSYYKVAHTLGEVEKVLQLDQTSIGYKKTN